MSCRFETSHPGFRVIRYEDLVCKPEATLRGVADHLGIAWHDSLLAPSRMGESWGGNSSFGQQAAQAGISSASLDRYRTELADDEIAEIERLPGPRMVRRGYALEVAADVGPTWRRLTLDVATRGRMLREGWRWRREASGRRAASRDGGVGGPSIQVAAASRVCPEARTSLRRAPGAARRHPDPCEKCGMTDLTSKLLDRLRRPLHIYRSLRFELDAVNTLCVTLGPNRNLTTLTASLVALHPQRQVLNHAWGRQREQAEALFEESGEHRFERFVRMAVARSQGGRQGRYGGSVTLSHAFNRPAMREAYERRYGKAVIKDDIRCVHWKSAKQVTRYVLERGIDLAEVAEREPRLRFMMPLRNPLDCALSNYRKGHHRHFPQLAGGPVEPVIDFVTKLVGWFLDLRRGHPGAFFGFLESEWGRPMLGRLASFLRVDADETWMHDVLQSQPRGSAYDYDPAHLKVYAESLRTHLCGHPEIQREFAKRAGVDI